MIRSSAARSIRTGGSAIVVFRGPGGLDPKAIHQAAELMGRHAGGVGWGGQGLLLLRREQRVSNRYPWQGERGRSRRRCRPLLGHSDEGPEHLDRDWEEGGRVVLRGDLRDRLEIP